MVAVYKCETDCVADSMKPDSGMSVYSQCPDLIPLERKTEKLQCQEPGMLTEFYRSLEQNRVKFLHFLFLFD